MIYRVENKDKLLLREHRVYDSLEQALQEEFAGKPAWLLFWEDYRVDFAGYDGTQVNWQTEEPARDEYLIEVCIFCEEKELHLRKDTDGKLSGRVLGYVETSEEPQGEPLWEKEETPYMWGSSLENGCLKEDRGMNYHLPGVTEQEFINVGYRVVSYYKPDPEDGMLRLLDYRLNGIFQEIYGEKRFLGEGGMTDGND